MDHFKFNVYRNRGEKVCIGGIGVLEHQVEPALLMWANTNYRTDLEQVVAKTQVLPRAFAGPRASQISAIIHPEQNVHRFFAKTDRAIIGWWWHQF